MHTITTKRQVCTSAGTDKLLWGDYSKEAMIREPLTIRGYTVYRLNLCVVFTAVNIYTSGQSQTRGFFSKIPQELFSLNLGILGFFISQKAKIRMRFIHMSNNLYSRNRGFCRRIFLPPRVIFPLACHCFAITEFR